MRFLMTSSSLIARQGSCRLIWEADMPYSVESSSDGCYEGTYVLKNKLDIRDDDVLAEVESVITTTMITMLLSEPYDGDFTGGCAGGFFL